MKKGNMFSAAQKRQILLSLVAGTSLALTAIGCSKDSSSDDSDDEDSTAAGYIGAGNGVSGNALSAAFPSELAFSAFPKTAGSSLALGDAEAQGEDPNANKTVREKVAENEERMAGEGDCFDPEQFRQFRQDDTVTCYEFDSDMNPSEFANNDRTFGTTDGTNGAGEACMVSFARQQMETISQRVDRANAIITGMLCLAKKDGLAEALPEAGESVDLAASLEGAGSKIAERVSVASITRLDDVDGKAVFRTDVSITDPNGNEDEIHLVHSPADDGSSTGTLWFKRKAPSGGAGPGPQQDPNNSGNKNDVMSINYAKTLADGRERMTAELRRASIVDTIEPFDADGTVAFGNLADDASNADVHQIKYVAFDMYPDTNEGTMSYWMNPGGSLNESARGFLFSITAADDGQLTGCGVSGATANLSIRKAVTEPSDENTLKPVRYWHPRESQNISPDKDARYTENEGAFITEQCFKQNVTSGLYEIDTSVTTHERGYEVVAQDAVEVAPPPPPPRMDGDFKPAE